PTSLHQLQQPEGERRYGTAHADTERWTTLASRVDQPAGVGAGAHRLDRMGQYAVLAFSTRLSDTVSGQTPTSQPQHSVRGRLTNGEQHTRTSQAIRFSARDKEGRIT